MEVEVAKARRTGSRQRSGSQSHEGVITRSLEVVVLLFRAEISGVDGPRRKGRIVPIEVLVVDVVNIAVLRNVGV